MTNIPADQTTVVLLHNLAPHHLGVRRGLQTNDPLVPVFEFATDLSPWGDPITSPARTALAVAAYVFGWANGQPSDNRGRALATTYTELGLRSLSRGDALLIGDLALACGNGGWSVRPGLTNISRRPTPSVAQAAA